MCRSSGPERRLPPGWLLGAALALASLLPGPAPGEVYPGEDQVIGDLGRHVAAREDSLMELARRFGLGYEEIARANPGVDPFAPAVGTEILLPTRWVVPAAARAEDGVVINLAELRLYYAYRYRGVRFVASFPVGIGREGWETPVGRFRVVEKLKDPAWYVPHSIRELRPTLPAVVPPGPENPLGTHALRLSAASILIHGTNKPWGVGRRASHGCIRLYPEDILQLYELVPVGTPVRIVREPVRVGARGSRVYLAALEDPSSDVDLLSAAQDLLAGEGLLPLVDPEKLGAAVAARRGFPVEISP